MRPTDDTEAKGSAAPAAESGKSTCMRRHMRFGWWSLLAFLSFGIVLEVMHGLKIGWYLDVDTAPRRLMWTLAHAHGTLLALVHIGFALTVHTFPGPDDQQWRRTASPCLIGASILLPGGFFLGGVFIYGGDPGIGILLLPIGALLLLVAVFVTARNAAGRDCSP